MKYFLCVCNSVIVFVIQRSACAVKLPNTMVNMKDGEQEDEKNETKTVAQEEEKMCQNAIQVLF